MINLIKVLNKIHMLVPGMSMHLTDVRQMLTTSTTGFRPLEGRDMFGETSQIEAPMCNSHINVIDNVNWYDYEAESIFLSRIKGFCCVNAVDSMNKCSDESSIFDCTNKHFQVQGSESVVWAVDIDNIVTMLLSTLSNNK